MAFDVEITNGEQTAAGWLTDDPIVPAQGYGGHPLASRPKRKGLTVWQGRQPFTMTVPLVLYRGGAGHSVEGDREALEKMAIIESIKDPNYRRGVKIASRPGIVLPIPAGLAETQWWIENLTWGEEVRDDPDGPTGGILTRKAVSVELLERVDDEYLGQPHASNPKATTFSYLVRKGDTLHRIAQRELGDANKWTKIKALNPKIRSDNDLHPNRTVLKLPGSGPVTKR